MKLSKKAGIFLSIAAVLTVLLTATASAGATSGSNRIFSELIDLTSSNPSVSYDWDDPAPTVPYTATLNPPLGYEVPFGITVQRIRYDDNVPDPIVSYTYRQGIGYIYDSYTGDIVIPVSTLQDIAFDGSIYDIRIIASGMPETGGYAGVGTASVVYSDITELVSTNHMQIYTNMPSAPYTATLSANPGYSLPPSIMVQQRGLDTTGGVPPYPEIVKKTYISGTDYTYNASTGSVVIPVDTLADIIDPVGTILVIASGVTNPSTFKITVTQSANGTISPASAVNISKGSDFTFIITPDSGFRISEVFVDGTNVGAVSSYTFTNIISNHTIEATFEETSGNSPSSETPSSSETSPMSGGSDDIPKTGDNSLLWFWWLLCSVSALSFTVITVIRKKALSSR
ncbi:MAG: hypothetical protein ACOX75_00915 [Lachnospiraceae bacterium]|jgi:hypothetical protein